MSNQMTMQVNHFQFQSLQSSTKQGTYMYTFSFYKRPPCSIPCRHKDELQVMVSSRAALDTGWRRRVRESSPYWFINGTSGRCWGGEPTIAACVRIRAAAAPPACHMAAEQAQASSARSELPKVFLGDGRAAEREQRGPRRPGDGATSQQGVQ